MPSNRTRTARTPVPPISPDLWARLTDALTPDDPDWYKDYFAAITFDDNEGSIWRQHRAKVLATWPRGSRPRLWWKHDAPSIAAGDWPADLPPRNP